ncbi:MAG: PorT family protein [Fibrobacteres bacterium]|nr:PorT family protein [Fibrobacterota bacterium]
MSTHARLPSLVLLLLALGAGSASAERKPVALGLLGGVTSTSYYGKDVRDFDFEIWPTVGFSLAFHLPAFLGVETDLLYVGKSGSTRRNVYDSTLGSDRKLVSTFKLHALEIPFMIKVTAPTGTEVQPIFFGGPSFAWFFSRKSYSDYIDVADGIVVPQEEQPIVLPENLTPYEWSLCVGAGVEWGLGSFQLRVNFGQKSLDKTDAVDLRTANLALMAGFIF